MKKKDYIAALNMMDKIIALQNEHNLTLPDEFHFKYAQVAFSTGSMQTALDAVGKYLSAETEDESYKEALALLIKIEEELKELEVSPEKTCAGKSVGSSCWMALTNRPECYVWNPNLKEDETVTWSGEYSGAFAQGKGTLLHNYTYPDIRWRHIKEATGHLRNGKRHGQWIESGSTSRDSLGAVNHTKEGPYVNGKRHGNWVERYSERYITAEEKGPYVNGRRHGQWIARMHNGDEVGGSYVNGKRHGQWVERTPDGRVGGGSYVDGKRQGHWVGYYGDLQWEGSFVDGKRHGQWVERYPDGSVRSEETYINGRLQSHRRQSR